MKKYLVLFLICLSGCFVYSDPAPVNARDNYVFIESGWVWEGSEWVWHEGGWYPRSYYVHHHYYYYTHPHYHYRYRR